MARILLVEDDKYLNKLLSDRLMLEGHQVISALDGEQAWIEIETSIKSPETAFEFVIADMLLPRMMGAELFAQIKQTEGLHNLQLIAISGIYKNPQEINEISTLYGLKSYLTKPFASEDLLSAISGSTDEKTSKPPVGFSMGRLEDTPIEALLLETYGKAFTGKLQLQKEGQERRLYFSNGFPVSADSSSVGESLGRSLILLGVITEAAAEDAGRRMVEEKTQFGQMLIKMGVLTKDQLFDALRKHTHRLLLNTFLWREGKYRFEPMIELPKYILPLEFNPLILMSKAHKAMYSTDFILSLFKTKSDYFMKLDRKLGQLLPLLNLDDTTRKLFEELPGDLSLDIWSKKIPEKNHEALFRILFILESSRLLSWSDKPVINKIDSVPKSDFKTAFEAETKLSEDVSKSIHAQYMDLLNKDYFEIFSLSTDAKESEIEQAYRDLRYNYHPDRFGGAFGGQTKRVLDDMLARIDKAYQTIIDPEKRQDYLISQNKWKEDSVSDSKKFLDAQDAFREGIDFINRGKFRDALQAFEKAQKSWNRGIEYKLYALYSDFKISMLEDIKASDTKLSKLKDEALQHRSSDIGYLLLGHAYNAKGQIELARDAYQQALKNNEKNDEAAIALTRLGEGDLKKARVAQAISSSTKTIKSFAVVIFLATIIGVLLWQRPALMTREKGIQSVPEENLNSILPASSIRIKHRIAKITVQEKWLSEIPNPVLQGKCAEAIFALKQHGIIELRLHETQGKLRASCRTDSVRRY